MSNETTSWIWPGGDNIAGVRWDREQEKLYWTVEIGCYCDGDDAIVQSTADFRQNGAPAGVPTPPQDVLTEINQSLN